MKTDFKKHQIANQFGDDLPNETKGIAEKLTKRMDEVSKTIKECEYYLQQLPIHEHYDVPLNGKECCYGVITFGYCGSAKKFRLLFSLDRKNERPLITCRFDVRVNVVSYLKSFVVSYIHHINPTTNEDNN